MSVQPFEIDLDAFREVDADGVRVERSGPVNCARPFPNFQAAVTDLFDLFRRFDYPLGEEKTGGKEDYNRK